MNLKNKIPKEPCIDCTEPTHGVCYECFNPLCNDCADFNINICADCTEHEYDYLDEEE